MQTLEHLKHFLSHRSANGEQGHAGVRTYSADGRRIFSDDVEAQVGACDRQSSRFLEYEEPGGMFAAEREGRVVVLGRVREDMHAVPPSEAR